MDRRPRGRSTGALPRGPNARRRRWHPTGRSRPTSRNESPTNVGEAAVAADGGGAASADGEAAVAADGGGAASAVGEAAVAADGGEAADAVNVRTVPNRSDECPCPLEDHQSDHETVLTITTWHKGDIICSGASQADLEEAEGQGEAAVAADGAQPKETKRSMRQPRDITPHQQLLISKWAGRSDADHVGNFGWLFWNWGKRPKHEKMEK